MKEDLTIIGCCILLVYLIFLAYKTCHIASHTFYTCDNVRTRFDYVFPSKIIGCWLREEVK